MSFAFRSAEPESPQGPLPDISGSREDMIRDAAYARAARRAFAPGYELEDWLAAERQVDEFLAREIPIGFYG
ncbi:MAG TPA: DUF2934 domain-containing protein [Steroidobacteraceae bacterium]